MSPADLSLVDLLGSRRCSSTFVCLRVESFQPTLFFIGGGCCSGALVLWALARRLSDCLLQQVVPDSGDEWAMTAARLRLASVLIVVVRWSTDLDVIFISGVRCTAMIKDE